MRCGLEPAHALKLVLQRYMDSFHTEQSAMALGMVARPRLVTLHGLYIHFCTVLIGWQTFARLAESTLFRTRWC
jgi:hypothetical protein